MDHVVSIFGQQQRLQALYAQTFFEWCAEPSRRGCPIVCATAQAPVTKTRFWSEQRHRPTCML